MSREVNEELLSEIMINSTDEEALRDLFTSRIVKKMYWSANERTKSAALEDMVRRLSKRHAYDYIQYATKILMEQEEEEAFVTAMALLMHLIKQSATTDLPLSLANGMATIEGEITSHKSAEARRIFSWVMDWYGRDH